MIGTEGRFEERLQQSEDSSTLNNILAPIPVGAIYLSTTYPTIVTSFWSQFVLFRHGLVTILVTTLGSKVDQSAAALLPASGALSLIQRE